VTREDPLRSLRSTPEVDPGFADGLESSLRVQHSATRAEAPRRGTWRTVLLVGPAIVLALVASAVLIIGDDTPSDALELDEATNVTVTMADGSTRVDPVGLELDDGMVVAVGPGGRAVIGDIELGPGSVVTVRDGEIVTGDPATTSTTPSGRVVTPTTVPVAQSPESDRIRTPDVRADSDDAVEVPADDSEPPRTTEVIDRDPADDPIRIPPPEPTLPPPPAPTEEPEPDVVDTPTRVVDLSLAVRVGDGAVRVGWRASGVEVEELRVVLLRSRGPDAPDPDWPLSGTVTIVGETTGSEVGELVDEIPAPGVVARYRVVALHGHEAVARSAVQTLALDR
jgi:hypothetical protein